MKGTPARATSIVEGGDAGVNTPEVVSYLGLSGTGHAHGRP